MLVSESFDVVSLLSKNGISFKERGVNVGRDFVNINCPYCMESRHHCGIHQHELWFKCFVCGKSGHLGNLIHKVTGVYHKIPNQRVSRSPFLSERESVPQKEVLYEELSKRDFNWLTKKSKTTSVYQGRGLLKENIEDFNIYSGVGKLKGFVVFEENENIVARRTYANLDTPINKWWKKVVNRPFLFGYTACLQHSPSTLVLVEGVFDLLRFPYGTAIALLGATASDASLSKIVSVMDDTEKIIIALDRNVNNLSGIYLFFSDLGYKVEFFNWDNFEDTSCKDVDDIAYFYGESYLYNKVGYVRENDIDLI